MAHHRPARPTTRQARIRRIGASGLLVAIAAIAAASGYHLPGSSRASASSSWTAAPPTPPSDLPRREHRGAGEPDAADPGGTTVDGRRSALGEADGAVPNGTTVFDDEVPGVANLDPDLLGALRRAAAAAGDDGVTFFVDSGWRSPPYQERLLHEAISKYGSEEEAARWVATPKTSAHVSGDAVDIGPVDATAWLSKHGARYGLCQIYRNEPWHYELRPKAIVHGCPSLYADPTHDPRMKP